MVQTKGWSGPGYTSLRPLGEGLDRFPIIPALGDTLADAPSQPDPTIARVLATCSGYAYSDLETVTAMMTRLGLPRSRCVQVSEVVDAMFICSNAFLIQSEDRRVVILCYRGTEPTNLTNWGTDFVIEPTRIQIPDVPLSDPENERMEVHGGFYRNTRATRYEVGRILRQALHGNRIGLADGDGTTERTDVAPDQLKALYITGHSLGGAMAVLMTILIRIDDDFAPFRKLIKGVYTFGQPMVGNPALARACEEDGIAKLVHRYVYRHDVVPHLPPRKTGSFRHFGTECRYRTKWVKGSKTTQMSPFGLAEVPLDFVARQFPGLSRIPFRYSLLDHLPEYYIQALTPDCAETEFGDKNLGVVARRSNHGRR